MEKTTYVPAPYLSARWGRFGVKKWNFFARKV